MNYSDRRMLYQRVEANRETKVLSFVTGERTSRRPGRHNRRKRPWTDSFKCAGDADW